MNKLLAKQLARCKRPDGEVDLEALAALVSLAYDEADRDRRRTERSIALMVEEVDRVNRGLEQLVDQRTSELKEVQTVLQAALNNMSQGLVTFDADARIVVCNPRYLELYRLSADQVKPGTSLLDTLKARQKAGTFSADDPYEYVESLLANLARKQAVSQLVELEDGRTIAVLNRSIPGGGWVATHEDITERRRAERQISHMARHDALTNLPNRLLLRERLSQSLAGVSRGDRLAMLYIDLDHFKKVNDILGHPVGDELLKSLAERLQTCIGEADTVARVGGDEFAVIQDRIKGPDDAAALARRILDVIREPFDLEGHSVLMDTSIGIALSPDDGREPNELLKNADMALYGAKGEGRGTFCFFESEMDARMKARISLEGALRQALSNGEFDLHYQPIFNIQSGEVSCCEALLRWEHPERGMISPAEFVPLAEEMGLITSVGEWLLRKACSDAALWPAHVKVAVNLSPIQLINQKLLPVVINALSAAGLSPYRLELEITEAVLMQESALIRNTLHQLRELGVHISMDDFGTGYSSLSYLRSFPFDKIKIDRSFVNGLTDSHESVAIVRAVTGLANSLNMATTAEGVETAAQLQQVKALGCTEAQGFLLSRPQPLHLLEPILGAQQSKTSPPSPLPFKKPPAPAAGSFQQATAPKLGAL